ncbi:cytochrome c oxidase assembly protein COX15 homolog [Zophobas morio]|uniref:cytochrome c oxidase assembly protein COX15 homolog n=1 Tax=Zophobas morio TaxID=2755281 RepID=UPI0030828CCA
MVNWHPVYGIRPPFSEKEWEEEFNEYKKYPEYKYVHQHLTLNDFKKIFIWEYLHRIWGRAIGIAFVVPAVYYCCKGYLNFQLKLFSLGISSLIGFQGFLGWYMVKSGLQDPNLSEFPYCVPRVSQYRLAAHLGSAFIIYGLLLHKGLQLLLPSLNLANKTISKFQFYSKLAMGLVFITALSGAFVAGLDAGLLYNTFPKMADQWIPAELLAFKPTWRNFFENPTTVQFSHRILYRQDGWATPTC